MGRSRQGRERESESLVLGTPVGRREAQSSAQMWPWGNLPGWSAGMVPTCPGNQPENVPAGEKGARDSGNRQIINHDQISFPASWKAPDLGGNWDRGRFCFIYFIIIFWGGYFFF